MVSLSGGKEKPTLLYSGWKDKSWVTKRHAVALDRKRERYRGRTGQDRKGRKGEAQRKGQSRKGSVRRYKAGQVGRRVRTRHRKNRKYFICVLVGVRTDHRDRRGSSWARAFLRRNACLLPQRPYGEQLRGWRSSGAHREDGCHSGCLHWRSETSAGHKEREKEIRQPQTIVIKGK